MTPSVRNPGEYSGRKVTVMGLGLFGGGGAAARFFASRGASVTVTDLKPAGRLARSVESLKSFPNIRFVLGEHRSDDFARADIVIVNPAVPKNSPYLEIAAGAGAILDTETNIFFRKCPAPIIGITGSNGKTTTTTLTAQMLKGRGKKVRLGGNIGRPLVEFVDEISPEDIVVMELSSFQLEDLHAASRSPNVAVVTNLSPNHLDRHGTMENYAAAKRAVIDYQRSDDTAVLNADDAYVCRWAKKCAGGVGFFSLRSEVENGSFLSGENLCLVNGGTPRLICERNQVRLPGDFNVANILAAAAAAAAFGAPIEDIAAAARSFRGVEHRLEMFLEKDGVSYFNDSIATTPESAIAALNIVPRPVVLIAGGYDKKVSLESFARRIVERCDCVVLVGRTAESLRRDLERRRPGDIPRIISAGMSFESAVRQAIDARKPGGSVLLSPGTASYDMFENFEQRGHAFKDMVQRLTG